MGEVRDAHIAVLERLPFPEDYTGTPFAPVMASLKAIEPLCARWFDPARKQADDEVWDDNRTEFLSNREIQPFYVVDLRTTLKRLADLLDEEVDEDHLLPTGHAAETAKLIIMGAYNSICFRRASLASDGDGGIRITWKHGVKKLIAVIPSTPDKTPYLYHKDESDAGIQYLEDEKLDKIIADGLAWLSD